MAKQPQGRIIALVVVSLCLLLYLLRRSSLPSTHREYAAPVVMLLATQPVPESDKKATQYLKKIIENREEYARHHGYKFVIKTLRAGKGGAARTTVDSWSRLFVLREALEEYPDTEWFWYLDQDAIIMDPEISITETILADLGNIMLRDVPVVPPDSVIRTPKSASPENMQFILSQDYSGLNTKSFLLRNTNFARYLLEAWTEPMYQSYGFDRKEVSTLEHLIQWHYTVLSKTALLPKRVLASFNNAADDMAYKETDFVVVLDGCRDAGRSCELEFERYWATRGRTVESSTSRETTES